MKNERNKTGAELSPRWRSAWIWVPAAAALDTLVIEACNHKLFTEGAAALIRFCTQNPLALAVNFLLILVSLAPAFFLRRRLFYVLIVSDLWLTAGAVNGFIILNRLTPFTTADLSVFGTGLETLPNYFSSGYIALLACGAGLLLALLAGLLLRGPKNSLPLRRRMAEGCLALLLFGGLLTGVWRWAFAASQLSDTFLNLSYAYEEYGFSYCFLQTWLNKGIHLPASYSRSTMERIAGEIGADSRDVSARTRTDVNVVVIQLESFLDPAEIRGLTLSEDPIPHYHALEEKCTSGYLTVPVVGAGTANTEFEVLTGMSTHFFGPGEYPFETCMQHTTAESLAYDLKALGYGTHAVHNNRATFYGRTTVYANLGFDDFTSLEYMPKVSRTPIRWAKDYVLKDEILAALDSTADRPDLVFTVTVQSHGKYPTSQVLENPAVTVETGPEGTERYALEYYVNQLREVDDFIGNLVESLSARKEKTVLVLYGDHLPSLNLTTADLASNSIYKTGYVLWSNFGLWQSDTDLYAYQLFPYVLGRLGITEGLVNRFHQFCQTEPSYRVDLKELEYDRLYGWDYLDAEPYAPSKLKMGVKEIAVTGLEESGGKWFVRGVNFSPYCKVTVGSKQLDTTYISTGMLRLDGDPGVESAAQLGISVVDAHKEVLSTVPPADGG